MTLGSRIGWREIVAILAIAGWVGRGEAQGTVATSELSHLTDTADALLRRPVTLSLDQVPLGTAIRAVARRAGVIILYRHEVIDTSSRLVTLDAMKTSLGDVMNRVLSSTRFQFVSLPGGQFSVVPGDIDRTQANGGIEGTIVDGKTQQPLRGVTVTLDDSLKRTRTDTRGKFQFTGVTAGPHRLTARYVGYTRLIQDVTVRDDVTATVTLVLHATGHVLDQVVVTATGEQRIRELPHIVSVIHADSVVRSAPITDVAELLQSRVPGLQVVNSNGGVAGAPIALRLRGQTSLSLNSEPIVIVDGVRYRSTALDQNQAQDVRGGGPASSPLNDLNVNDIETVEVVKGPSASTLYGPEASNGVIVITTKRGKAGPTQWHWHARPVSSTVPQDRVYPKTYAVWSHDPNDPTRVPLSWQCDLVSQYKYHACVVDSVTPATSVSTNPQFALLGKNRPTWQYGLDVGGGSPTLRYFLSGNYDRQVGAIQVAPALISMYKRDLGLSTVSEAVRNPNTLQNIGTHGTVAADPSPKLSLSATTDYSQHTHHRLLTNRYFGAARQNFLPPGATGSLSDSATVRYLRGVYFTPFSAFQTTEAHTSRFTGIVSMSATPSEWLSARGDAGIDVGNDASHTALPGGLLGSSDPGAVEDDRRANTGRTMNAGVTARLRSGSVSFSTAVGVQYIYSNTDGINTSGTNLAPGSSSIGTARTIYTSPVWVEAITLGSYVQEQLGFNDRLFLDGALRVDGSSRFGDKYHPTPLPKLGASWILSDEPWLRGRLPGVRDLKLRAAYGAATRYPTSFMKLGSIGSSIVTVNGQTYSTFDRTVLTNPDLRPERSREIEYGADAVLFSRVNTSIAWYNRRTLDELKQWDNPTGIAAIWRNSASVAQHGFEATVDIPLFDTRGIHSDVRYMFSYNRNKILSLGDEPSTIGYVSRLRGYPTDAIFGVRTTVVDTVGGGPDGIVFPEELGHTSPYTFMGVYNPPYVSTVTPSLSFWHDQIRVTTVFDHETGFLIHDDFSAFCMQAQTCPQAFNSSTPILLQAKYQANNFYDWLEPGDFTRWREIGITMTIPQRFLQLKPLHVGFSHASFSLQGRNLAIWTKYKGPDPEAHVDPWIIGSNASGIPLPHAWSFRFDITP